MKVLVTGGSSLIGSNLVDRLLACGDELLMISNYATGRGDNLGVLANLQVVEETIADKGPVQRAFKSFKPEKVVHAAALYKDAHNWVNIVTQR